MLCMVNGEIKDQISVLDRGLFYGDGLFETMKLCCGRVEFLDRHLSRLEEGCRRLQISFNDMGILRSEIFHLASVCGDKNNKVVKVIITRGIGGRGYFFSSEIKASRIIIISDFSFSTYEDLRRRGIKVRYSSIKLSPQPSLAGIKHLNRLEQVLARNEWEDGAITESLMFDIDDNLIEGVMSNVFLLKSGYLRTPRLDNCGIDGIMRRIIIEASLLADLRFSEAIITRDELEGFDGSIFMSNSLMYILPVCELNGRAVSFDNQVLLSLEEKVRQLL